MAAPTEQTPLLIQRNDLEKGISVNSSGSRFQTTESTLQMNFGRRSDVFAPPDDDISKVVKSTFHISKLCCSSEVPLVQKILSPLEGIEDMSFNIPNKLMYVTHTPNIISATEIASSLNTNKFGTSIVKDGSKGSKVFATSSFVESSFSIDSPKNTFDRKRLNDAIGVIGGIRLHEFVPSTAGIILKVEHDPSICSARSIANKLSPLLNIMVLSDGDGQFLPDDEGEDVSGLNKESSRSHTLRNTTILLSGVCWVVSLFYILDERLKWVALPSITFGLPNIVIKSFYTVRRRQIDANCLMFVAVIGAVALGEYVEGAAVAFLFSISEVLEHQATSRAREALYDLIIQRPERANLMDGSSIKVVPATLVPANSIVIVRAGDKVPCDGVVEDGESALNEASLTGESRPIRKTVGDDVYSGTINIGEAPLIVRTTKLSADSTVAQFIQLVEEAQARRSPTEKLVDKFANIYTPSVVIVALASFTIPWLWGKDVGKEWLLNGLILLVIACPCALIISTPVTYVAGLTACAQKGVIIKGGAHLEEFGRTKLLCFDKTGTLTQGSFSLEGFKFFDKKALKKKQIMLFLKLVKSMQQQSSHPIGAAFTNLENLFSVACCDCCAPPEIDTEVVLSDYKILTGEGICARFDGIEYFIGNQRLFKRLGLLNDDKFEMATRMIGTTTTLGFFGYVSTKSSKLVAVYNVTDSPRKEAKDSVAELKNLGCDIHVLTGDNEAAAYEVGESCNIPLNNIHHSLLPDEKLEVLRSLKDMWRGKRHVCMIGDGINDAPALAFADLSVAMGAGAALAMQTADVTLLDSDLKKLVYSIKMGRRVHAVILQNVIFSIGFKIAIVVLVFMRMASLWAAICADVGSMLIVTLNSMKLIPRKDNQVVVLSEKVAHYQIYTKKEKVLNTEGCKIESCSTPSTNVSMDEFDDTCNSSLSQGKVTGNVIAITFGSSSDNDVNTDDECGSGCYHSKVVDLVGARKEEVCDSNCYFSKDAVVEEDITTKASCKSGCCSLTNMEVINDIAFEGSSSEWTLKPDVTVQKKDEVCGSGCCSSINVVKEKDIEKGAPCDSRCCFTKKVTKVAGKQDELCGSCCCCCSEDVVVEEDITTEASCKAGCCSTKEVTEVVVKKDEACCSSMLLVDEETKKDDPCDSVYYSTNEITEVVFKKECPCCSGCCSSEGVVVGEEVTVDTPCDLDRCFTKDVAEVAVKKDESCRLECCTSRSCRQEEINNGTPSDSGCCSTKEVTEVAVKNDGACGCC